MVGNNCLGYAFPDIYLSTIIAPLEMFAGSPGMTLLDIGAQKEVKSAYYFLKEIGWIDQVLASLEKVDSSWSKKSFHASSMFGWIPDGLILY